MRLTWEQVSLRVRRIESILERRWRVTTRCKKPLASSDARHAWMWASERARLIADRMLFDGWDEECEDAYYTGDSHHA